MTTEAGKGWIERMVPWIAVALSAVSASISVYTLHDTLQERKAAAAVTLSIENISGKIADLRNHYDKLVQGAPPDDNLRNDANGYIHYLEYVALLINTGRIDRAFVADVVKCHIRDLSRAAYNKDNLRNLMPRHTPNIDRFRDEAPPMDCPNT
jgi:hypothetical protein